MPTLRNTPAFAGLMSSLLERGAVVRFRANGCSMGSAIRDGEAVYVEPMAAQLLGSSTAEIGEILLTQGPAGFKTHRLVSHDFDQNLYITQGDSVQMEDTPVRENQILGRVIALERHSIFMRLARRCAWMLRRMFS